MKIVVIFALAFVITVGTLSAKQAVKDLTGYFESIETQIEKAISLESVR